jgi:hypothetical protein
MSSLLPIPTRHILPLFISTSITLACIPTYFNPPSGIRAFGLPDRIATSPAAHSPWILYTSRIHAIGIMSLIFHARGDYEAVDTVMGTIGVFGLVDGWVCWKEGVLGTALWRSVVSLGVGVYGALGGTSGGVV